jgi:hypothetical protein
MTWLRSDFKIKKLPMQFDSAIQAIREEVVELLK